MESTWDNLDPALAKLLNPDLLVMADEVRAIVGPMLVNDYHLGGKRRWCGFRDSRCPEYRPGSQHSKGCAIDGHPTQVDAETARNMVRKALKLGALPLLGGIEINVPWLHLDIRPRVGGKVLEFHA